MKLEGKIALITGGSAGIGLATAKAFTAEGAKVIIVGRRQNRLAEAAGQIGPNASGLQGDASNPADLDRIVRQIKDTHGRLDVVFANAGTAGIPIPLGKFTESDFSAIFDHNVKSVLFTVQCSLPLMSDGGAIILTSSMANVMGLPGASLYGATKAAVRSFARTWANELKPRRIRVNAISPGPVKTEMHAAIEKDPAVAAKVQGMLQAMPLGRMAVPDEIARAVVFLASDDASYITGTDLYVDGGMTQV